MEWDDVIYISLLGFSIFFGRVFSQLPCGSYRRWVGTCVGLAMVVTVSGYHSLHPLFSTAANLLIIKYADKAWCHIYSLVFCFGYLFLFRLGSYFGLPSPPGHTNAIQMMITLKLVGVCFEVHDSWQLDRDLKISEENLKATEADKTKTISGNNEDLPAKESDSGESTVRRRVTEAEEVPGKPCKSASEEHEELLLRKKYEAISPSVLDVFHYSFFYCGILTGPYYKYSVYRDLMEGRSGGPHLQPLWWCLQRLQPLPLYAALFFIVGHFFPLKFAEGPEIFSEYSLGYRVLYMTPVFFVFRMRLYAGFVLSECVCITAGLGAYPQRGLPRPGKGPTDLKALDSNSKEECTNEMYSYETVHNIDEYGSDFSPTVRAGMRCWNMTVQWWLATNVYRRMKAPKPVKEAVTMLTSAFWHGMHSGYYLSMLTVPFILMVEDYYARVVRRRLGQTGAAVYDWFTWFLKMQWFY
ncbi:lysophospholipid acyltransferase 7 isoform X1 [Hyalella azteca]|uniref:Lysophospholipid acyltransferase 7 n=1 Tax=Hyalella azteca TaxID=294128 RepID=A0A8B7PFJ8_HYAAZ|nr:lysophospholipid acyltransferase 7 isoform X1 [Hyalella azteca]